MADDFQRLLGALRELSRADLLTLDATMRGLLAAPAPAPSPAPGVGPGDHARPDLKTPSEPPVPDRIAAIEAAFATAPECPHCQSEAAGTWGAANGLRRYRCRACRKSFNALTGTPLAQLHKRELWSGHAQALVDGISLRKVAERLDVDLTTAFRWRHRFLKAPKALKAKKVQGTVEVDETYFRRSHKGTHKLQRKGRKRGGDAAKAGLSNEQGHDAETSTFGLCLPRRRQIFGSARQSREPSRVRYRTHCVTAATGFRIPFAARPRLPQSLQNDDMSRSGSAVSTAVVATATPAGRRDAFRPPNRARENEQRALGRGAEG